MDRKTRGQAEDEFTRAIVKMEREYLGRGPADARTYFVGSMILVRLQGILTPAELKLATTEEGKLLVKETRRQLFETSRDLLEDMVQTIVGCELVSMHTDMSTRTDERVIVLTVDRELEQQFT